MNHAFDLKGLFPKKKLPVHENIGMSAKYGIRASYFGKGGDLLGLAYLK